MLTVEDVAKICYDTNKSYCESIGDMSFGSWDSAPDWQKETNMAGVRFRLQNPNATPEDMHNSWMDEKSREGWSYGPVKDPIYKAHPCMVPYWELPPEQKVKDYLFSGVVNALKPLILLDTKIV